MKSQLRKQILDYMVFVSYYWKKLFLWF